MNEKEVKNANLICKECGGVMKKSSEGKSGGAGCIVGLIGLVLLFFFPIGTVLGALAIIYSLHLGTKRRGLWVCKSCGHQIERKIKWYELG